MIKKRRQSKKGQKKRKEILDFITVYAEHNGICPTLREIGDAVELNSTAGVYHHIEQMGLANKKGDWDKFKIDLIKDRVCITCGSRIIR